MKPGTKQITIEITDDDYAFLMSMTGYAKMKVIDLNERDGFRIVSHSVKSLIEAMVHRSTQAARNESAKAVGVNPSPY